MLTLTRKISSNSESSVDPVIGTVFNCHHVKKIVKSPQEKENNSLKNCLYSGEKSHKKAFRMEELSKRIKFESELNFHKTGSTDCYFVPLRNQKNLGYESIQTIKKQTNIYQKEETGDRSTLNCEKYDEKSQYLSKENFPKSMNCEQEQSSFRCKLSKKNLKTVGESDSDETLVSNYFKRNNKKFKNKKKFGTESKDENNNKVLIESAAFRELFPEDCLSQ